MALNRSTAQVDVGNNNNGTVSIPLTILDPKINFDISLNACGLFAQTSINNEKATAFARVLSSAVDAEPVSYQQEDASKLAAVAILTRHPELLFQKGIATDHFGRKIWASPYQIFLGACDTRALKQVHDVIIPMILNGEAQAKIQFQQQFPNCPFPPAPDMSVEALYDKRNKAQIAEVIELLKIIVVSISADPCTDETTTGFATLAETKLAVEKLRQLFAPKVNEVIRTGLHFPMGIMNEIFKTYDTQFHLWSGAQLAFFSREVIGTAEAALTAVDGQWFKNGLTYVAHYKNLDRRNGLFCRQPYGIPKEFAPINNKLGRMLFVDPYDGATCNFSSQGESFNWYHNDVANAPTSPALHDEMGRIPNVGIMVLTLYKIIWEKNIVDGYSECYRDKPTQANTSSISP